jgi:tRNA(Ile)-lysidine synthase
MTAMEIDGVLQSIERLVARERLLEPGGPVTCLVSGGPDSTCLHDALHRLGHVVRAVHVHHGVRGAEADADAEHCRSVLAAEVVRVDPGRGTEAELRDLRYAATAGFGLRATGHTRDDQVETVLYRLISSGSTRGVRVRREDGVVRPLLDVTRAQTHAYCARLGLPVRDDSTNPGTLRGRLRDEILPALRTLDPRCDANLAALAAREPMLPRALERALATLLASYDGEASADLGGGLTAVRSYDELRLEGAVRWGPWRLESTRPGLVVRSRRPGDRLAGRRRKVQDLLVDAKVPRGTRDEWPIVVDGGEVVAVPGIAEAPGWEGIVIATREDGC